VRIRFENIRYLFFGPCFLFLVTLFTQQNEELLQSLKGPRTVEPFCWIQRDICRTWVSTSILLYDGEIAPFYKKYHGYTRFLGGGGGRQLYDKNIFHLKSVAEDRFYSDLF
jgi:hypothetical protein